MQFVREVIEVGRTPIKFEEIFAPKSAHNAERDLHHIKTSIRRNRVALKGCIETKDKATEKSQFNLNIKSELDLYISIVHCRPYLGVRCLNPNIDIILARQNTEGEYLMLEHETVKGNVESMKVITKQKTEQFAKWALHYARAHHRNKVTIVHKRDVYALADGMFVDTIKEQARDFKDLRFYTMSLTNFLEQLIKRPQTLDFVMIPNLYGCVATNIVCGLLGGPGLLSKKSYSDYYAVFEPAVGSLATQLEGKDLANPVATLNALRDMLAYLKMEKDATAIDCAIRRTLSVDKIHTPDIGGNGKTSEFMERVKFHIRNFFCSQPR
ncbi:isocitrate dehydrogenase [NAD] subunit gamma, mitochondrial-like isoform X2 [Coccinella septempunctata]|nr:isocitrate dehydrogenase [NAD] subunit gamma, mitochondrial-like isoform X2 [Coccinella septempunctata]